VRKHEGKKRVGRPRRRWEDGIEKYLKTRGWSGVNWIHPVQDMDKWRALLNTVMNGRATYVRNL
jgi:hypothetical protein